MRNILIVDDHSDIRRLLSVTLGRDYAIVEAQDGISAMEIIGQQKIDLMLLDVMMPGEMDGLQVLQAIKNNPDTQHILVAMVSARGQTIDSEEACRMGADAYFVKPFSPLRVVAWVREKLH